MNKNKNVWFYILGILSGILFIPVIEEFINVIMSWIQVLILKPTKIVLLKPTKIVLEGNKEINELQGDEEYQHNNCIGFQIPSDDEYYCDEDDE